ncbi:helix-turn-helix transcriptional regulator [Allosphingosinicella flava]|uniref:Helix-turn-helix transcriptional regulator n=1 Tax=Allosphingosinicella flava TaxID=2771430 RepID=A0A7T2GI48_9SPHN|nr:helix-turn-helix transcriptional regulator [Sphingosinicella flava]QPQ54290.1 helix-turn-helix transcriptional regulator [Sphingosinicella flava]
MNEAAIRVVLAPDRRFPFRRGRPDPQLPSSPAPNSAYHRRVTESGLKRLTDGQKACLRMVYRHMSSKDIARSLGISPHTVDQRLRIAMHTLGVCSRIEAARLLAHHENGAYQPIIYQAPDIASSLSAAEPEPLARSEPEGQADGRHFRQAQAFYSADPMPERRLPLPLRKRGGRHNGLGTKDTLIWVVAIPILAMVAVGMLATGLNVLATLVGFPLANFQ